MPGRGLVTWKLDPTHVQGLLVGLEGDVSERFEAEELLAEIGTDIRRVVLDCAGIRRMNSEGVRRWIYFVRVLRALEAQVVYTRCSLALVAQMNMVPEVATSIWVSSVYAPYACEATGEETERLLQLSELGDPSSPPSFEEQGRCFEFDDLPERFFAFLIDKRTGMYASVADLL